MSDTSKDQEVSQSRRSALIGGAGLAAAAAIPLSAMTTDAGAATTSLKGKKTVSTVTTKDGVEIYYKDWGSGPPIVFCHGWPLSSDSWEAQMFHVANNGFRAVAHDRRGHGRSSQPWTGNDMDTYADDLGELIEELDLHDGILVVHSTGGGEVTRYIGRYGTSCVAKTVLVGAIPPLMLK